jgi:hypothetical protein
MTGRARWPQDNRNAIDYSAAMKKWLVVVWLAVTALVVAPDLYQFADEHGNIRDLAVALAGDAETPHELASAYSLAVHSHLQRGRVDGSYEPSTRPLLRATAWETWTTRHGHCGEASRIMINLLISQGVPATRVNMIGPNFVHTAVGYWDGDDWFLVDSFLAPSGFREWSQQNRLPISAMVEMQFHSGGGTPIEVNNPFFTRFSYFNWARVFKWGEINQRVPFPAPITFLIENPPLFTALLKFAAAAVVLLVGWLVVSRRRNTKPSSVTSSA